MDNSNQNPTMIDQAGEDLFNYAIEREDIKLLMDQLAQSAKAKPSTLDYELQILKIISVGWSISYYLSGTPRRKTALGDMFWNTINDFSQKLSQTTGLMTGADVDYFEILKERLNQYVQAMEQNPEASDPAVVIGPVFAGFCGHGDDMFAAMAGTKIFANTVMRVRQYLEAVKLR
jgi:hypothetical protein